MDLLSNLFKKSKSKNMPPQKQAETCDNQNKNAHLFDMESSFLQNSVMIPAEFDSNQNSELAGSNNSNQENQKPRYSILTTFDPIIKKETDEVKLLESCNESLLNANVLNKTGDFSKTFLSPVTEDFVEKTVEVEVATQSSSAIELNRSSSANTSTQSDNSVLNNTVILNKSLAVENITPDQSLIDANRSCTVTESDLPLTNLNDSDLNNEQNLNTTDQTFVHGSSKVSLNLSTTLKQSDISVTNSAGSHLNTPEQSFVDGSPASFNESSTLKPDASFGNSSNITEQNYYTASENNISVDGSNKSLDVSFTSTQKPNEETAVITSQDIKTVIGHLIIKDDEYESVSSNVSDSFIDSFATKLIFSPGVSEKTEIKDIYSDKEILNEQIETEVNKTKIETKDEKYINADSEILNAQIETTVNESKIEDKNKRDLNTSEEILNEQIEIVVNETKIENKDEVTVDLENKNEINSTKVFCDIEIPHEISVDSEKFVNDLNVTNILSDEKVPVIPDEISVESVKIVNDLNNTNILSDEKVIPDEISLEAEKIVNDLNNTNILSDEKEIPDEISLEAEKLVKDLNKTNILSDEKVIPDEISLEAEKLVKDLNKTNILSDEKVIPDEISLEAEKLVKDLNKTNFSSDEKVSEISDDIGVESVKILNDLNKTNISSSEKVIPNEISLESEKIVKDLNNTNISSNEQVFVIPDEIRVEQVKIADDNKINISSDEKVSTLETVTDKNISFEINTNNLQEKLSETANKEYIKECSLENKNVSFEVINTSLQTVDALIENNKEEILKEICPTQSLNSTYENKSVIDTVENLTPSSTLVAEETHMSASEPNSGVNEPTVANRLSVETNAACTNEMGEIINPNECFEKQLDITNGAIDNKESLEAKARVYNEMAEKYALVEAECEKFKVQVADLKKELKSCRQKSVALEAEVADLKRKENELNVLLEEYKQSTASKGDAKEDDAQLKRLQASEEALKNEVKELTALVNQHESRLKELQRKEVKLADDLTSKTQSEMQISRVMEEYEKSLSSLISDNEKMKKERDTAQMHLANIEMAFSDVHQKYERCKAIVQGYKDNEESYKQDIAMNRETIVIQEQKYESLKAHAMKQLEISNQELATMKKQHETEMARLTAQLKRYEIKTQSLMESLQQKAKECEQLSAVCDEFIGNV